MSKNNNGGQLNNQNAVSHGGEAAVKAIQKDEPFTGLARQVEAETRAELETEGRAEMVTRAAVRLETAARLYWGAIEKAAQDGDLKALDRYVARFGWLQSSALRAWAQVREEQKNADDGTLDYEKILGAEGEND